MLVLYSGRQGVRQLLMVEDIKFSSCVNYRWVRGSECDRNSDQQGIKAQLGRKQNAI